MELQSTILWKTEFHEKKKDKKIVRKMGTQKDFIKHRTTETFYGR